MKVIGYNGDHRLGGSLNSETRENKNVKLLSESRLDISSLSSFSTNVHSVWIKKNGEAYAVGKNFCNRISSTIPNTTLENDTKINIEYQNGRPCKFISAVGGCDYTLYQVFNETGSDNSQLVLAYQSRKTIFLNVGKRSPLSLFGGYKTAAVIDTEGAIMIITESIYKSPESEVESFKLPSGDRAVKVACCEYIFIALGQSGKVFRYLPDSSEKSFLLVDELAEIKIIEISGNYFHFFAVSEDGRVFGCGNNYQKKLGMLNDGNYNKFTLIESLNKYQIVEAFSSDCESLFKTSDGKIIVCGFNNRNQLMTKTGSRSIYPPEESQIPRNPTFCILGSGTLVAFYGVEPPPNTPNRKISKFDSPASSSTTTAKISAPITKEASTVKKEGSEILQLKKLLETKEKEISTLKKENFQLTDEVKQCKERIKMLENEDSKDKTSSTKRSIPFDILDQATIDNLNKVKSLGRGATSEVFEVTRAERFALKVYNAELCKEDDDDDDDDDDDKIVINIDKVKRFIQEYEVLNQLNDPNIIKTFGISFGDSSHPPSILLEYCPSNLRKKIKKLSNDERICAIVDISSAMKAVHAVGIIHRDLKLENIMVDSNNKIKVSDFGLCTLISKDSETMSRTQMAGTLKYMAPELVQERTDYDEKVDVYAFGVVVFLILTKGEFPKITLPEVASGKQADIPTSISEFSRDLISKCWSYKSEERPSFAEICAKLKGNENKLI